MYTIAEIGINHNGDLETALKLIDAAKAAGFNCVKFQKCNPDICIPEDQKSKPCTWKGKPMTYLEYKHEIEFGEVEYMIIDEHCHKFGIDWTVSVWDIDSVRFMKQFADKIPFIKIPSACITDMELLEAVNELNIPVYMSCGMSTKKEILDAYVKLNRNIKGMLWCNSSYPCAIEEINLNAINELRSMYSTLIGYSGHEIGYLPTLIAASMDVDIIERHITLDKNMEGTDHAASLDIADMTDMMKMLERIDIIKGKPEIIVSEVEAQVKEKLRKVK